MIRSIAGNEIVNVRSLRTDLRTIDAIHALVDSDVIFGCVDNDGPRLVLNELALAYMIPYIDCAVGINVDENRMEAGGRIVVVQPDSPCLICCKEIDTEEASNYLAPPAELRLRKIRGYVSGAELMSPAVVSLNGAVSSAAVTEFLFLMTGLKPAHGRPTRNASVKCLGERVINPTLFATALERRLKSSFSRLSPKFREAN
jgi:molybdopterin/thiamine biosynthesis adenylyltransferase